MGWFRRLFGRNRQPEPQPEPEPDNHVEDSAVELEKFVAKDHAPPERARDESGQFRGDDKSTKDVNEAWKGGKAPKR
jgi:hypothetical protein